MTQWKQYQTIAYDGGLLKGVQESLKKRAPPVTAASISRLKEMLASIVSMSCQTPRNMALIVQLGYCAETFADCRYSVFKGFVKLLKSIEGLFHAAGVSNAELNIVPMLRMAGQYCKPRSLPVESVCPYHSSARLGRSMDPLDAKKCTSLTVPSYQGDIVNSADFTKREPDLRNIVTAYEHACRALDFIAQASDDSDYSHPIFTIHEALCLPYEEALCRSSEKDLPCILEGQLVDTSAHSVWLGERTAFPDSLHLHFMAKIANPVGIKVGPFKSPDIIIELLNALNPLREPGKIMLITRLGSSKVCKLLPAIAKAVQDSGHFVLWICDPMHGNTHLISETPSESASGCHLDTRKIRYVDEVILELKQTHACLCALGMQLHGVHLEASEDPRTTECIGGRDNFVSLDDVWGPGYTTLCDPRLNPSQTLEVMKEFFDLFVRSSR